VTRSGRPNFRICAPSGPAGLSGRPPDADPLPVQAAQLFADDLAPVAFRRCALSARGFMSDSRATGTGLPGQPRRRIAGRDASNVHRQWVSGNERIVYHGMCSAQRRPPAKGPPIWTVGGLGCCPRPPARDAPGWNAWRSNSPCCPDDRKGYHCDITFPRQDNGRHRGALGRETDMDLADAAGTVCRRCWARTCARSRVIRGRTPGSYGRGSPGAQSHSVSRARCAARPGYRDLAGPRGREAGRAGRHHVAVRPSNGKGTERSTTPVVPAYNDDVAVSAGRARRRQGGSK
jgi:hypothetical protein